METYDPVDEPRRNNQLQTRAGKDASIAALEAEVERLREQLRQQMELTETMRVAAHELMVERDDARRDITQEEAAARSAYSTAAAAARALDAAIDEAIDAADEANASSARVVDTAAAVAEASEAYNAALKGIW